MKNTKRVFETAIVQLCKSLSKEEIRSLDAILTQKKDEIEILKDIIRKFPTFNNIYAKKIAKKS